MDASRRRVSDAIDMKDREIVATTPHEPVIERGIATDVITAAAQGAAFGAGKLVVEKVADTVFNRPSDPPEPPAQVVLPPGVDLGQLGAPARSDERRGGRRTRRGLRPSGTDRRCGAWRSRALRS